MKIRDALEATMNSFSLSALALSNKAGITHSRLSRFLGGKPMVTDGLDDLFKVLNDEQVIFLISKLVADRDLYLTKASPPTLAEQVNKLDQDELGDVLQALSQRVRSSSKKDGRQLTPK